MKPNALKLFKLLYEAPKPLKIEGTNIILNDVSIEYMTLFLYPLVDLSHVPDIELNLKYDIERLKNLNKILDTIVKEDLFRIGIIGEDLNMDFIKKYHPYQDEFIMNKRYKNEFYFSLRRSDLQVFMNEYENQASDIMILTPGNHAFMIPEKLNDAQKEVVLSIKSFYELAFKLPKPMDFLGMNLLTSIVGSLDYLSSEYDMLKTLRMYKIDDIDILNRLIENHEKPFVISMVQDMKACTNQYNAQRLMRDAKHKFLEEPWETLMETTL